MNFCYGRNVIGFKKPGKFIFLTDAYDFPAFRYYLNFFDVACNGVYAVTSSNDDNSFSDIYASSAAVFAVDEIAAAELFAIAGLKNKPFQLLHRTESRGLYVVVD